MVLNTAIGNDIGRVEFVLVDVDVDVDVDVGRAD